MKKNSFKKAFTLVEMLIVVVIIGLLASVMIGRYQSFLQSSRDTARQTSIKTLGTALEKFRIDWGDSYPEYSGCINNSSSNTLYQNLVASGQYIDKLPLDPVSKRSLYAVIGTGSGGAGSCEGEFGYATLYAANIPNYGYGIVANAETPKGMNILTGDGTTLDNSSAGYTLSSNNNGEDLQHHSQYICNTVNFTGANKTCGDGVSEGGIKKGQEHFNGWFLLLGGG